MKLINYLKSNLLFSIIIGVIISIFIVGIIGSQYIEYKRSNWSKISEEQVSGIEKIIREKLNYTQQKLILQKDKFVNKIIQSKSSPKEYFQNNITELSNSNLSIGIFDEADSLVIWNDHYNEQLDLFLHTKYNYNKTYFSTTDLSTYLVVQDTFTIANHKYVTQLAIVIEKEYQLNPIYFEDFNLTRSLSQISGVECKIEYSNINLKAIDGRKHSFVVLNNFGEEIGVVIFVKPSREKFINELRNTISIIQSMFTLFGYLLVGLLLYMQIKNHTSLILKFIFFAAYLIVFRYLILILSLPSSILSSELLSDKIYYSNFGNGIAQSPIDLLITQIIVLIIVYMAFLYLYRFYKSDFLKINLNNAFRIIFVIVLIILYLLILRGFGAGIRGFVFDTTLRYFQNTSLNTSLPHFIMHLNVLILGFISVFSSISLILFLLAIIKIRNNKIIYFGSIFIFLVLGIIIFSYLQTDPQITIPIKLFHVTLILATTYLIVNYNYGIVTKTVFLFLIASFISIITLLNYNSELEKKSLETTANVILRANENWYKSLINETINSDFSREEAISGFSKTDRNFNATAFKIWSKSKLQKESINSSVNIISLNGELLGGFGSIYPKRNIKEIVDTNNVIEEVQIFEEPFENESQKLIRGIFPVKDHYSFLGYLDVSILMDLNDFGFNAHTELFSTGKLNEESILELDKLVILDFQNKKLSSIYGELNPSKELNKKILNVNFKKGNEAWTSIENNGSAFVFYVKKKNYTSLERVIAVGLRNKDLSISLFDFFKVFFNHAIILLIIGFVYVIVSLKKIKKYQFNLRTKLLMFFLILSLIPLILTAFYFRSLTSEKNETAIYYKLGKRAFSIEDYFEQRVKSNWENTNIDFGDASRDLNINYSLFDKTGFVYSSSDLLYDVGLIPQKLNYRVFSKLVKGNDQEILLKETIDKFKFNSFYYKANILDKEMIIKVSDAFNKILLPLSGSEVDVFLFGTYSLAVLLIIGISALLANQISSPIRKLTLATKSVAAGDLSLEIKSNASGELKDLVDGFHFMIKELKRNQNIIAEIEREEAWKEMAKQVAHEIKNPLTPMKLSIQQLVAAYEDKSNKFDAFFTRVTTTILNQIETLRNIANEFSNFGRMPKLKVEKLNLVEVAKQSANLFADENAVIDLSYDKNDMTINGDSEQLRRTIINLIRNSIQAGSKNILLHIEESEEENILSITDDGYGIEEQHIDKIFEPNFTTKKDGMGLGLSMTKRYLKSTGASINVSSTVKKGTTIIISFPRV